MRLGGRGPVRFIVLTALAAIVTAAASSAAEFAAYREFRLGMSVQQVVQDAKAPARDLKTLHERPSLLQELLWRPPFVMGRPVADRESVRGVVFSFVDDQLFRIAVEYDRSRTEGMTADDMAASLAAVYGERVPLTAPARRPGYDVLDVPVVLAMWRNGDTEVVLQRMPYNGAFGLLVTSVPLEQHARQAKVKSVAAEAREAPAREAARVKADAAAAKAAAEKLRTTNKAVFKP